MKGGGNDGGEAATGQATVPDESQKDISVQGFWKWGTTALFGMRIVNLDTGYYLRHTSAKALAMAEQEKKDKHLQPCLERRRSFNPIVYSTYGIPGMEAVAAH